MTRKRPSSTPTSPKSRYSPGSKLFRPGSKRPKNQASPKGKSTKSPAVDAKVRTKLEGRLGGMQDTETPKSTLVRGGRGGGGGDSKTRTEAGSRHGGTQRDTRTLRSMDTSSIAKAATTRARTRSTPARKAKTKAEAPRFYSSSKDTLEKRSKRLTKGTPQAGDGNVDEKGTKHKVKFSKMTMCWFAHGTRVFIYLSPTPLSFRDYRIL